MFILRPAMNFFFNFRTVDVELSQCTGRKIEPIRYRAWLHSRATITFFSLNIFFLFIYLQTLTMSARLQNTYNYFIRTFSYEYGSVHFTRIFCNRSSTPRIKSFFFFFAYSRDYMQRLRTFRMSSVDPRSQWIQIIPKVAELVRDQRLFENKFFSSDRLVNISQQV